MEPLPRQRSDEFFSGEGGQGFDGFASHALGINLEGNGNEILLTRDREREGGVRWAGGGGGSRNLHGKSAFSGT